MTTFLASLLSWLCHHYPLSAGYSRILYSSWLRPLIGALGARETVRLRNGLALTVLPQDEGAITLALFGSPDPRVVALCRALLRSGDVFLDIGSNFGSVGLLCSDVVGALGIVHLFEPQPQLCACLRRTLKQSLPAPTVLHEVALMDRDGALTFRVPPGLSGGGSAVRGEANWLQMTIPARAIGPYLKPLIERRPVGVKIDVEGAEGQILPWLFKQRTIRFILWEATFIRDWPSIWRLAQKSGWPLFGLLPTVVGTHLERIADGEQAANISSYKDVVAVRGGERVNGRVSLRALAHLAMSTRLEN